RSSAGPRAISPDRSCPRAASPSRTTAWTAASSAQASSMPTVCDPWPGKTKAIFIGSLHSDEDRAPGEAAAHTLQQDRLARADAAVTAGRIQRQRHAGRRGVGVLAHGDHDLVVGNAELAADEI